LDGRCLTADEESKSDFSIVYYSANSEVTLAEDFCNELKNFNVQLEALSVGHVLVSVKGRLLNCIDFVRFIGALSIIKDGYKIPFITTPPPHRFKNNSSALKDRKFVSEAIL